MAITKTLTANVTAEPGYTYKWVVETVVGECGNFTPGDILGSGTLASEEEELTLEITYEETCESLTISLVIEDNNNVCDLLLYDVTNDDVSALTHWECINTPDLGWSCQTMPGSATLPTHYNSLSECTNCTNCFCNIEDPPGDCFDYNFGAVYNCPSIPAASGLLTITLTNGPVPFLPVTVNHITIVGPSFTEILSNVNLVFESVGSVEVIPITLPPGTYSITPIMGFGIDCFVTASNVNVLCDNGGGGPVEGDMVCCEAASFYGLGGGDIGNIGNVNVFVLYYGDNIDPINDPLVIDFGTNTVADKLEVYNGVVAKEDIVADVPGLPLIGATSYVGLSSSCLNQASGCFTPAVGDASEPRNTVLQGMKQFTGVYSDGGTVTNITGTNKSGFTNPAYAADLYGTGLTHNPGTGAPVAGQGGGLPGTARLIIPANTYNNVDKKVTLAVHNNGTIVTDDCCDGYGNQTAWKLWVHCPDCPECLSDFTADDTCDAGIGGIEITITEEYEGPTLIQLVPDNPAHLEIAVETPLYIHLDTTGLYYELIYDYINNSLYCPTLPSLVDNAVITAFYDVDEELVDMPNGGWTITITGSDECSAQTGVIIDCDCEVEINASDLEICIGEDITITFEVADSPCQLSFSNTTWVIDPEVDWLTATIDGNDVVFTNTDTPEAGTYDITLVHNCDQGNCYASASAELIVNEYDCAVTDNITDTTCGNTNGEIELTICPGGSVTWLDNGSTSTTRSNLAAGTYVASVCGPNGCCDEYTYTVADGSTVEVSVDDYIIACKQTTVDSIEVTVSGGTAPYSLEIFRSVASASFVSVYTASPYVSGTGIVTASVTGGLIAGLYNAVITDDNGCISSTTFMITSIPVPPINVLTSPSLCELPNGQMNIYTAGLTADHLIFYFEEADVLCDDIDDPSAIAVPFTPGTTVEMPNMYAGTYSVCIIDTLTNCCDCKNATIYNVGLEPDVPDVLSFPACVGSSVNLLNYASCPSGSTPTIFTLGGAQLLSPIVTVTTSTSYIVKCTAAGCTSEESTLNITAIPAPTPVISGNHTFCKNNLVNLATITASCTGTGVWSFVNQSGNLVTYTATCNGTSCNMNLDAITAITNTINAVSGNTTLNLTFTCTANSCVGVTSRLLTFIATPTVQTNNLSVCPSYVFANAAAFASALGYVPVGYSCTTPAIYTNSGCTTPVGNNYVGPTAGNSVTLYLKTTCIGPEGVSCASSCVPFTVTGTANQTLLIQQTTTCSGGIYSTTYTAPSMNGTYQWLVNGVTQVGATINTFVLTNQLPSTTKNIAVIFTPNPGSGLCNGGGTAVTTYPALPTIITPAIADEHCATDPATTYNLIVNNATNVSYVVTGNSSSVVVTNNFTTNGQVNITTTSVVGTATVTVTATNAYGCTTNSVVVIDIVDCTPPDPCANCLYTFNALNSTQSSLTFGNISLCGQQLNKYILLIRDSLNAPIAYVSNTLVGAGPGETNITLAHPSIDYVVTFDPATFNTTTGLGTPIAWNLPLIAGDYKISLVYTDTSIPSCASCVENTANPLCYYLVGVTCATCQTAFSKEYASQISGIVSSPTYQLCVPCTACYRLQLETFGQNPDGLKLSLTPDFSSPTTIIPTSLYASSVQTLKLGAGTTLPYQFDYSAVPCIDGKKTLYLQVESGVVGEDAFAKWKLTGSCCNCLTTCPAFTSPCVDDVTVEVDGYTYNIKPNNPTAASAMSNILLGSNKCHSRCDNISDTFVTSNASFTSYMGGTNIAEITQPAGWDILLGVCSWNNCVTYNMTQTSCVGNPIRKIFSGSVTYTKLSTSQFRYVFSNVTDYNAFKTVIQSALTTPSFLSCAEDAKRVSKISVPLINHTTLPSCNDVGTDVTKTYYLQECENEICNDLSTVTFTDVTRTVDIVTTYAEGDLLSSAIITCPISIATSSINSIVTNAARQIQSHWQLMTATNSYPINYGASTEECYSFNRYTLRLIDTDDEDSWILYSELKPTCTSGYAANDINEMSVGTRYLLQFGDAFADAADAIAEAALQGVTLSEHPDGATQGAGNCIIFS